MSAKAAGDRIAANLQRLDQSDLATLRKHWRESFGKTVPEGLPRWLLQRGLAYRTQAAAFGDLDRDAKRKLSRLAAEGAPIPLPELPLAKPGTLVVREWEGLLHRVMVLEEGFAWNGQTWPSLSAVAFAITGTKWNGPRFFGLRAGSSRRRSV